MKRLLLFSAAAIAFCLTVNTGVQAQTAEQKAWEQYMTPGEVHQMIAKSDGEWSFDMSMWMDPSQPPTKSTGTTVNKMVLGGRYQESVHKSSMMGMPFEGHGLMAYDNARKVFQSSWIDNMGTGIMNMEGKWDDATKSITFTGKSVDPMSGKEMGVKEIYKIVNDDQHDMEMYMVNDGKDVKTMEIKFTRKK
jgi:hypothetical protein